MAGIGNVHPGDLVSLDGRPAEVQGLVPGGYVSTATFIGATRMTRQAKAAMHRPLPLTDDNLRGAGFTPEGAHNHTNGHGYQRTAWSLRPRAKGGRHVTLNLYRYDARCGNRNELRIEVLSKDESASLRRFATGFQAFSFSDLQALLRLVGHDGRLKLF